MRSGSTSAHSRAMAPLARRERTEISAGLTPRFSGKDDKALRRWSVNKVVGIECHPRCVQTE
jgi:hypothetical protein